MKQYTNNQILLDEIIQQEFKDNATYEKINDFFEYYSASIYLKNYDLSDEEIEKGVKGAGLDGGCDAIYLFANGILINDDMIETTSFPKDTKLELFIIQSKNTYGFNEDSIMKWKTVSRNLMQMGNNISDFKGRYNDDVLNSFTLFRDLYIKLIRNRIKLFINYIYISKASELHPNVQAQADELKEEVSQLFPSSTVEVRFVDANTLMDRITTYEEREYNLQLVENPITVGKRKDYIALVNLSEYYSFIIDDKGNIQKNIFESNVRDYQGNTSVNSDIQETLKNKGREDFWWLNNGITILASEVLPMTGKILKITDPEIVNGLQTSTEIFNFFSNNKEAITNETRNVLVRIVVPTDDESRDKIILATNSQTNIPKASLRATDTIHRQIEMYFKSRGLYYDRRKNYYKNLGKKSSDIISVSFLAQCLIAILLQKPDYARARPSTLLNNEEFYKKLYIDNDDLEVFYLIAIIGRKIENSLKNHNEYSKVEIGDIIFYVMLMVVAHLTSTISPTATEIRNINPDYITKEMVLAVTKKVYDSYQELGGSSKIAKGPELIKKLMYEFDSQNLE